MLLGPSWRWYTIGWAAAGLGVITKGVGFLPLLVLVPFAMLRDPRWQPRKAPGGGVRWLLGPLAFLAAVSIWLVPMLLAANNDPTLAAYRDEILFDQTIHRYGNAWHHREPFWYFLVNVIPGLWLPLTLLVPWLFGHWRNALRSFDLRIALLASWIVLVVLFFSFSTGKRGVYVSAGRAGVRAAVCSVSRAGRGAAWGATRDVRTRCGRQRTVWGRVDLSLSARRQAAPTSSTSYDIDPRSGRSRDRDRGRCRRARSPVRDAVSWRIAGVLATTLLIVSFWVNPQLNDDALGRSVRRAHRAEPPTRGRSSASSRSRSSTF